ncbi:MAG: heme exporter protein CcmD [Comamonas sp.]
MQDHSFYLSLAYGLGAALLVAEVLLLWRRSRRARHAAGDEEAP